MEITDWAVQFRVEENLPALGVYIVDFDGIVAPYNTGETPLVGPFVIRTVQAQLNAHTPHLGYTSVPTAKFSNDPMQVRQAVYNYDAWAAIIINANATALLRQALAQGNTSYDPLGAAQLIYVEARDQTTVSSYLLPMITKLETQITSTFGQMWSTMVLQNATNQAALSNIRKVPQAVNPAIGFSTFNLRPFMPAVAIPAVTIGLICMSSCSF